MELLFSAPPHETRPNDAVIFNQNGTLTPLTSLVSALERATETAKRLSSSTTTATAAETVAAVASLRDAHQTIGSLLSQIESRPLTPDGDEPMSDRREGENEVEVEMESGEGSRIIEEVEEGMRECVLQSKRRKRRVSPSWLAGRAADRGEELSYVDPMDRRRSAMDLVFQFHA